jgi:hypothetical protein
MTAPHRAPLRCAPDRRHPSAGNLPARLRASNRRGKVPASLGCHHFRRGTERTRSLGTEKQRLEDLRHGAAPIPPVLKSP